MNLKELATGAAEFLDSTQVTVHLDKQVYWDISPHSLFESSSLAPIMMHLAKREMEKREFVYNHSWDGLNHEYLFMKPKTDQIDERDLSHNITEGFHPEEFIAFWTALLEAVR